jgi:hypothetical protein
MTVEEKKLAICEQCRHYEQLKPSYPHKDIHHRVLCIHECWLKYDLGWTPQGGWKAEEIAQTVQVWQHSLNNFTLIERNSQFVVPENCPYILEHAVNEEAV